MSRSESSPFRYDREEVRRVLETEGLAEARTRYPVEVVMPIARAMGLTRQYRPSNTWKPEWNALLGTKPDQILAGELLQPTTTIAAIRRKLGIPAFSCLEARKAKVLAVRSALAAMSDIDLLRNIGVIRLDVKATSSEIKAERDRRGLSHKARYRRLGASPNELQRLRAVCIRAMRQECPAITLEDIGAILGVTRERARQIEEAIRRDGAASTERLTA